MSLSPLQEQTVTVIVTIEMITFITILVAAYVAVRTFSNRAKIKASAKPETRVMLYQSYARSTCDLASALGVLTLLSIVSATLQSTLIRDVEWNGYTVSGWTANMPMIHLSILVVSALLLVIVLATKPWRPYVDTIWYIQDGTEEEAGSDAEQKTGQEESASA